MTHHRVHIAVLCLLLAVLACVPESAPPMASQYIQPTADAAATVVAAMGTMGEINFHGSSKISAPASLQVCTGDSDDSVLHVGSPRPDGLIRSELQVRTDFIWDGHCGQTAGSNSFYAAGLYDPKTETLTFSECAGDSAEGSAALIARRVWPGLDLGFDGTVVCLAGGQTFYELDFSVRFDPFVDQ